MRRVSAAMQKKIPPRTMRFGSRTVKYGIDVGERAHRSDAVRVDPRQPTAERAAQRDARQDDEQSTAIAPAKRPDRYSHFRIGALKKKCSTRYSKSCCTARPMSAAMTVERRTGRGPKPSARWHKGELIQTLPLPNETDRAAEWSRRPRRSRTSRALRTTTK